MKMMDNNRDAAPDKNPGQEGKDKPNATQGNGAREGSFKNVETGVNNPGNFDDDFAADEENKISQEEARTEKEGRTGKS
jgi:hypothetical protein